MAIRAFSWRTLSGDHLRSAVLFATGAGGIETTAFAEGRARDRLADHQSFSIGATMSAVAFAEAWINEFLAQVLDDDPEGSSVPSRIPVARIKAAFSADTEAERRLSVLEKYQLLLALTDRPLFVKGAPPWQDAELVVKLRNELVHYRPRLREIGNETQKLAKALLARFESPARGWTGDSFPHAVLSFELARWAIESVAALVGEFRSRIGLHPDGPATVQLLEELRHEDDVGLQNGRGEA